jgi:cytochrome c oxidase subunit 2
MRSQDVHSAYMPYFRAQMNCVPGMVTQFAFEIYTQMSIESCLIWLKSS